jgi:hypothetical protein
VQVRDSIAKNSGLIPQKHRLKLVPAGRLSSRSRGPRKLHLFPADRIGTPERLVGSANAVGDGGSEQAAYGSTHNCRVCPLMLQFGSGQFLPLLPVRLYMEAEGTAVGASGRRKWLGLGGVPEPVGTGVVNFSPAAEIFHD